MHDRTRRPSIWTVHAPHSPRSHDFFGPVNANSSRNASRSVERGSTFSVRIEPLTVILKSMRKSLCDCAVCVFIMFSWLPSEILRRTVDSRSHCTGSDVVDGAKDTALRKSGSEFGSAFRITEQTCSSGQQ